MRNRNIHICKLGGYFVEENIRYFEESLACMEYSNAQYTGWKREQWAELCKDLISSAMKVASTGCARFRFPGPKSHHGIDADEMEGFSRTFIMTAPWLTSFENPIVFINDQKVNIIEFYKTGLLNGTNPSNKEYWGSVGDNSQNLVEMASIAWGLFVSKQYIWDRLSYDQRDQVASYFAQCLGKKYYPNNWQVFRIIINTFLKKFGYEYSEKEIEDSFCKIESFYVGDGWYSDGSMNSRFDYYNSWAFHYYLPIWCLMDGASNPERAELIKKRLAKFIENFAYFFSDDGSIPAFGRSLTYRFAVVAPFIFAELLNCSSISHGKARRICSANIKWHIRNGSVNSMGLLDIGFTTKNYDIIEKYSCGASPYWAGKVFNAFLLPQNHPFWTAPEEPLMIEKGSYCKVIPAIGILVLGDQKTGHIQLINQKSYHNATGMEKKYTNYHYSNIFSFESKCIQKNFNYDNSLIYSKDMKIFKQRSEIQHLFCTYGFNASCASLFKGNPNEKVYTSIITKDDYNVNIHFLHTKRKLTFIEGGYPLGFSEGNPDIISGINWEAACKDGKVSYVQRLFGYDTQIPARAFYDSPGATNIRYGKSVVPAVASVSRQAGEFMLASLICGRVGLFNKGMCNLIKKFMVDRTEIIAIFHDGEQVFVQMGETKNVDIVLNGLTFTGKLVYIRVSPSGDRWITLSENGEVHGRGYFI